MVLLILFVYMQKYQSKIRLREHYMYWYRHLYFDKKCIHHINRLKYKIEHGEAHKGVYLINLPRREGALLELIPSILLQQSRYPRESLCIIGMGSSRGQALELMRQIIDAVYREQGNFDIASYLQIEQESIPEEEVMQT